MLNKISSLVGLDDDTPPKPEKKASAPPKRRERRLDGIRLLVVDDSAAARIAVTGMAKSLGAEVEAIATAADTLARFDTTRFDLLLISIDLWDIDGADLIRTIRTRRDWAAYCPVIAVSSDDSAVMSYSARSAGANHVLTKPYPSKEGLARVILATLSQAQQATAEVFGDGDLTMRLAKIYGDDIADEMMSQTRVDLIRGVELLRSAIEGKDREKMHHAGRFIGGIAKMMQADQFARTALKLKNYNPGLVDDTPLQVLAMCEKATNSLETAINASSKAASSE